MWRDTYTEKRTYAPLIDKYQTAYINPAVTLSGPIPNPPDYVSYANNVATVTTVYRGWHRTPGFRQLMKDKLSLPQNLYTYRREVDFKPTGNLLQITREPNVMYTRFRYGQMSGTKLIITMPTTSQMTAIDNEAKIKLRNSIKDMKVNVAQMIAERRQTMSLIVTTAIRIAGIFNSLKRGDIKGAINSAGATYSRQKRRRYRGAVTSDPLGTAAAAWLELQYGWKPLLSDVFGSAEQAGRLSFRELTAKVIGKKSKVFHTVTSESPSAFVQTVRTNEVQYTVKYTVTYGTPNLNLHLASQLGLTNPLLIAWELLPYSFVVDWFLPIGNWISSMDATTGVDFVSGTVTRVSRGVQRYTYVRRNAFISPSALADSEQSIQRCEVLDIQRTPLGGFPHAPYPAFKNPVSLIHGTNALALLAVVFRR